MQWFMPFIGFDYRYRKMGMDEHETNLFGQKNEKDTRRAVSLGFMYTLPMLVNFQAEVYHDGIVRLSLMREDIPISKRLRGGFMVNTDLEYMADLKYLYSSLYSRLECTWFRFNRFDSQRLIAYWFVL